MPAQLRMYSHSPLIPLHPTVTAHRDHRMDMWHLHTARPGDRVYPIAGVQPLTSDPTASNGDRAQPHAHGPPYGHVSSFKKKKNSERSNLI
ncbi:hypothetical protein JTE90_008266 [Oedothorax gibbosus]|uniref:Uncharacterized protein n=1 Tax=Oedothorax gibbosus TaxID=931172 RepID=A0AAV6UHY1_9ARAC|nr:hypothetical protein JTE90_008266 [Oedothorax gibbosus]